MFGWITKLKAKYQEQKRAQSEELLSSVKILYHTFRILLANNERALTLLSEIDVRTATASHNLTGLSEQVKELLDCTFELVDGLYRMESRKSGGLYQRYQILSDSILQALGSIPGSTGEPPACLFLEEITPELKDSVGSKAASLSELKKIGLPVPDGFVITIGACRQFLRANSLDLLIKQKLRQLKRRAFQEKEIEQTATEIAAEIMKASLTDDLAGALKTAYQALTANTSRGIAVRSSANVEDRLEHSFAGQFETVLNITTWDDLVTAFKRVLASNFNARCISYRQQVDLPVVDFDMAVLCLIMIPAKAAGVLFTMDPGSRDTGRMLISAVPGLGTSAVDGEFATDLFYPSRTGPKPDDEVKTAEKHKIVVCHPDGGIVEQTLDPSQSRRPLLNRSQLQTLVNMGLMVESLSGQPQDIEWAVSPDDTISILQARPLHLPVQIGRMVESLKGKPLVSGGAIACSGRVAGRVQIIRSLTDFEHPGQGPRIMVLHQSMVDAARWISDFSGVIVDIGNPGDHLSCVARENGRPMLTGTENATRVLHDGQLIVLDTDRHLVFEAPESIWGEVEHSWRTAQTGHNPKTVPFKQAAESREVESLRKLIVPLNLTDAYGPTFSILECQSIHDIIRYIHEMGILTMFEASDRVLFGGGDRYRLETDIPFYFQIIDLGGGIISSRKGLKITLDDVVSAPFLALWEGVSTPGLRWSGPPPHGNVSGLISRSMLDGRSARPVGSMNYVLLAFDYINLNARMDYHFTMLDSVCSTHNRDNYIRFRFKGGGTSQVQRERRTAFIATVLSENDFFTATIGDMVTGTLTGTSKETIREKLIMIGRLLGFSRLMDAAMTDDSAPVRLSRAFLEGDYTLEQFGREKSADPGD